MRQSSGLVPRLACDPPSMALPDLHLQRPGHRSFLWIHRHAARTAKHCFGRHGIGLFLFVTTASPAALLSSSPSTTTSGAAHSSKLRTGSTPRRSSGQTASPGAGRRFTTGIGRLKLSFRYRTAGMKPIRFPLARLLVASIAGLTWRMETEITGRASQSTRILQ